MSTERVPHMAPVVGASVSDETLRGGAWSLLGRLLAAPPDPTLLQTLAGIETADDGRPGGMAGAWQALRDAAREADAETLAREYQDVFIGVAEGEVVPYASYYASGQLMDKALVRLRRDLGRLGFERREGVSEPEDHAAAVCDTMAALISDPETPFEEQGPFFERHLAPWLDRFFSDLCQAPSARFYRAVGLFGQRFIDVERQYLSMLA